eukprot:6628582-Pyramimonas_sp.AAC.1
MSSTFKQTSTRCVTVSVPGFEREVSSSMSGKCAGWMARRGPSWWSGFLMVARTRAPVTFTASSKEIAQSSSCSYCWANVKGAPDEDCAPELAAISRRPGARAKRCQAAS